jgi:DNA-binding NarL/FixJ family response regulator
VITLSIAIAEKALWNEVDTCLQNQSIQIDSEQQQVSDLAGFLSGLERSKPDLVLIDVSVLPSTPREAIEKIRIAAPGSMIVPVRDAA